MKRLTMRFFAADNGGASASPVSSESSAAAPAPGGEGGAASAADANASTQGGASQPSGEASAGAKAPSTSLEAVKAALEPGSSETPSEEKSGTQGAATKPGQQEAAQAQAQQPGQKLDPKAQAEADKQLPFHNHPRWKEVIAERDQAVQQVEAFKADAEEQRAIQAYMQENDIPASEVANALQILAALRNDPAKAREMLAPLIANLDEFTGEKLPADLQKKVDEGLLDAESAKEIAKLRAGQAFTNQRGQERQQKSQQQRQQEAHQQAVQAVYDASAAWEQQKATTDPDWAKIAPLIQKEAQAIMFQEGPAKDAKAATDILERAYASVKEHLKTFVPVRKPTAASPGPGSSIPAAAKQPTSSLEAARMALGDPT